MEPEFLHLISFPSKNIVLLNFSENQLTDLANHISFIAIGYWILQEASRKMHIIYSDCDIILFF